MLGTAFPEMAAESARIRPAFMRNTSVEPMNPNTVKAKVDKKTMTVRRDIAPRSSDNLIGSRFQFTDRRVGICSF
jgi:hypothetical protein